jgi:predicted esterase
VGESSEKPVLTRSWQEVRKDLDAHKFPAPEVIGKEQNHAHKLSNGHEATFYYYIPASYDPAKPTPLAFFLHGGVSSPEKKRGRGQWQVWKSEADREGWIAVSPSGTDQCLWWKSNGEEHVLEAIRFLSARYNIDRNRVFLSGFSDGASGTYSIGMRLTDYWAACIPWNGAIGVVTAPHGGGTPFYSTNCKLTAWRATHGSKDQLYPSAGMKPSMDKMIEAGVKLEWKNFEGVGHEGGKIIAGDREFIDEWLAQRKRDPLPREIDWTTHDLRYGQAFWTRILALGDRPADPFKSEKDFTFPIGEGRPPRPVLGVQIDQEFAGPGVRISAVTDGTGAQEAGVKEGDILTSANGTELSSFDDLRGVLGKLKAGDTVKLAIKRGDETLELNVPFRMPKAEPAPAVGPAGRIRATRDGNSVAVLAKGVTRLEILVSPDAFDLAKEIVVTVNGQEAFKGVVTPSADVMLDEIRRRLGDTSVVYVAKITLDVPGEREY